jgi:hypothetical protein
MDVQTAYFDSMVVFSKAIMKKCSDDSDEAVRTISSVIDILLKDSSRISKMSADTQAAIKGLEGVISEMSHQTSGATLNKLIKALSGLVKEHRSVNDVLMPIVEALQFQDSIRQQMENLGKIMGAWLATRIELGPNISAEQLTALGDAMLKMTTMRSEREIIRMYIPGLAEEAKVDDVMMF